MPNSCRAPGCKAGYKPRKKKRKKDIDSSDSETDTATVAGGEKITLFSFPSHKSEPERRARWIARVPGDDWHPKEDENIFLCEKHFMPNDILDESTDSNSRRKKKKNSKLSRKRVKDDALPCIWPDLPEHLTKVVTPRPTSLSSSESRQGNAKRLLEEAEQDRITRDTFHSLSELISKEGQLLLPPNVCKVVSDNYIIFYKLDFNDDIPKMRYSVQVLSDLSFILCLENEKIPNSLYDF